MRPGTTVPRTKGGNPYEKDNRRACCLGSNALCRSRLAAPTRSLERHLRSAPTKRLWIPGVRGTPSVDQPPGGSTGRPARHTLTIRTARPAAPPDDPASGAGGAPHPPAESREQYPRHRRRGHIASKGIGVRRPGRINRADRGGGDLGDDHGRPPPRGRRVRSTLVVSGSTAAHRRRTLPHRGGHPAGAHTAPDPVSACRWPRQAVRR
jgi:hypothetical protein